MSDDIERMPITDLERRASELRKAERMMSANDELVHLEVQGVKKEQELQLAIVARMRTFMTRIEERVTDIEIDRDGLLVEVTHLRAECEQMHIRQNATDARLDTLKAIFDAGLTEIREVNKTIRENNKTVGNLLESVAGKTEP